MRKLTVVLVAAMILLAGCSGGGGGAASPTEESETEATATGTSANATPTGDSMEGTPMTTVTPMEPTEDDDTSDDSQSSSSSPLQDAAADDPFRGATVFDGTTYNGTTETTAVIRNDTSNNRELVELTRPGQGTAEVYTTADYVAYRNGTTGAVEYGEPDSRVGSGITFSAGFTAIGPVFYVGILEWEQSGTTTVDGEDALVFESDSLNQTALEGQSFQYDFQESNVQSVDGQVVIRSDGRIQSTNVQIETGDGTYGGDLSITYDDITVNQPGWVNETRAP